MDRREFLLGEAGRVVVVFTELRDGDFSQPTTAAGAAELRRRRAQITRFPWFWCRQMHGCQVGSYPQDMPGYSADALITDQPEVALSITVADCVPIAVWSSRGALAAIHAGWRGLQAGVVGQAVSQLEALAAGPDSRPSVLHALVGPHICPNCYEFSRPDAAQLQHNWGADVLAVTPGGGHPSKAQLNLALIVQRALTAAGVDHIQWLNSCSSCDSARWFSHRARAASQRNAMVLWRESV